MNARFSIEIGLQSKSFSFSIRYDHHKSEIAASTVSRNIIAMKTPIGSYILAVEPKSCRGDRAATTLALTLRLTACLIDAIYRCTVTI